MAVVKGILEWLLEIDASFAVYHEDFLKLQIFNTKCLKYVKMTDLDKFSNQMGPVQRRMIRDALDQLRSPKTKKMIEASSTPEEGVTVRTTRVGSLEPVNLFPDDDKQSSAVDDTQPSAAVIELNNIMEDITTSEEELQQALEFQTNLEDLYRNKDIVKDHSKSQCSHCHLYLGHTKRNCKLAQCTTSEMCGDPAKHKKELSKLKSASDKVARCKKLLQEKKTAAELKQKMLSRQRHSFENRMESFLIDMEPEKYLFSGGTKKRQGLLYADIQKLKECFRGKIPENATKEEITMILRRYKVPGNPITYTARPTGTSQHLSLLRERGIDFSKVVTSQAKSLQPVDEREEQEQLAMALKMSMQQSDTTASICHPSPRSNPPYNVSCSTPRPIAPTEWIQYPAATSTPARPVARTLHVPTPAHATFVPANATFVPANATFVPANATFVPANATFVPHVAAHVSPVGMHSPPHAMPNLDSCAPLDLSMGVVSDKSPATVPSAVLPLKKRFKSMHQD